MKTSNQKIKQNPVKKINQSQYHTIKKILEVFNPPKKMKIKIKEYRKNVNDPENYISNLNLPTTKIAEKLMPQNFQVGKNVSKFKYY